MVQDACPQKGLHLPYFAFFSATVRTTHGGSAAKELCGVVQNSKNCFSYCTKVTRLDESTFHSFFRNQI